MAGHELDSGRREKSNPCAVPWGPALSMSLDVDGVNARLEPPPYPNRGEPCTCPRSHKRGLFLVRAVTRACRLRRVPNIDSTKMFSAPTTGRVTELCLRAGWEHAMATCRECQTAGPPLADARPFCVLAAERYRCDAAELLCRHRAARL